MESERNGETEACLFLLGGHIGQLPEDLLVEGMGLSSAKRSTRLLLWVTSPRASPCSSWPTQRSTTLSSNNGRTRGLPGETLRGA